MTDYSQLSYRELCAIANNDAIADGMSEEEYERLSREIWKKFRVENRITSFDPAYSETRVGARPFSDSVVGAPLGKPATATK
jgi:hypothetical protein